MSFEDFNRLLKDVYEEPDSYPDSLSVVSLELAKQVLTPAKLEIIKTLKEKNVDSLSELAEELDRSLPSLSPDCKELVATGLIRIEKNGKQKRPFLAEDHLIILY